MRAVYFNDGEIDLREVQEVSDEGKRVHVRSIGICGSDLHMLDLKFPIVGTAGHEVGGVLDDGTPVATEPLIPCNKCVHCQNSDYNLCQQAAATILRVARNGVMADELFVPVSCFIYLPANVDVKDACLIEPLAVAVHGIRKAGLEVNQRVAVIGVGNRFPEKPFSSISSRR